MSSAADPQPILDPTHRIGPAHIGDDDDLKNLASLRTLLHPVAFAPGQRIFGEGEPGDRMFIIESGIARIQRHTDGPHDQLIAIAGPGDIFAELTVFDPGPHSSTVIAVTEISAGWLDRTTLRGWISENPDAGMALLQLLARQVRRRYSQFTDMVATDTTGRVARQLLYLAARFGVTDAGAVAVSGIVTDAELGELAGVPLPDVTNILSRFEEKGWIRRIEDRILLLDSAELEQAATEPADHED